jgi:hypothetical protein
MSDNKPYSFLAVAYVLAIYLSSGKMRDLSILARQIAGDMLSVFVTVGLVLILLAIPILCRRALSPRRIVSLLPIFLGYGLVLWWLTIPEERFHLLQYGLLTFFCAKALPDRIQGRSRLVLTVLLVGLAGIGDELIQWIRPNRVGDLRDVLINLLAAVLAQALIVILSQDKELPHDQP